MARCTPNGGADRPKGASCCRSGHFQPAAKSQARLKGPLCPVFRGRSTVASRSCILHPLASSTLIHVCRPLWPCLEVLPTHIRPLMWLLGGNRVDRPRPTIHNSIPSIQPHAIYTTRWKVPSRWTTIGLVSSTAAPSRARKD